MIGKSTGKDSEMHRILQQFDHLTNDLANVGMDLLYSLLPFLRFLPLRSSMKIKEWFRLKQQITETFEKQAVCPRSFHLNGTALLRILVCIVLEFD